MNGTIRNFVLSRCFVCLKSSLVKRILILASVVLIAAALSVGGAYAQDGSGGAPPGGAPPSGALGAPPDGDMGAPPDGDMGFPPDETGDTTNPALTETCGVTLLDGTTEAETDGTYDSAEADVSALCAMNGATVTLENATITKTGDTSSADQSSFYGLNAAVLVGSGSSVTITGGTVTTDGDGTNGVFSTGDGSTVALADLSIEAIGDGAHAVMATLGGAMTLTSVDMYTTGAHSGAIATDRGSGTIDVTGGTVLTTGQDSPGIYSTGAITVADAEINSTGAEVAVIEGANSITLTDSNLTSSLEDKWGVMIYQSFSGDAEGSDGIFTMTGGTLADTAASSPLFFITNATGYITLRGVDVTAESGILVNAAATERWGTSGENGGNAVLIADAQTLSGDFSADTISTLDVTLENSSTLTGAINPDNTAQAASLTMDETSTWTVTADSYLSVLLDDGGIDGSTITNIVGNGHAVYYDASLEANSALGGLTYTLVNGGTLQPAA